MYTDTAPRWASAAFRCNPLGSGPTRLGTGLGARAEGSLQRAAIARTADGNWSKCTSP